MGTRYHATFESTTERNNYRIEIDDAAFSGASTEFTLAAPGFQINHEGDGINLFEGEIRSSRATIFPAAESSGFSSFLQNLTANQETDLVVRIFKNGTTMADLFWIGTVLPDLNIYPKEHRPYIYSLTAVDGLGRLENFEFEYATNSANPEWVNMHDMFVEALKYTGLYSHFAITDTFIRFSENWFDVNQITTRSTFVTTQCRRLNLLDNYEPLQPDNLKALNCKQVIQYMLKSIGACIEFSRGSYRVFAITNATTASITEYNYAYDGVAIVYLSTTTVSPQLTINTGTAGPPRVLTGANWAYRRPVLQCRVETDSVTSVAVYKAYNTTALSVNCGNFDGSLSTKDMILAGRLTFDNTSSSTGQIGKFVWTITVGAGASQVWLKRNDDGSLTWTNVAWTLDTVIPIERFAGRYNPTTIEFELKIPALTTPNTGDIVIGCVYYNFAGIVSGGKTWSGTSLTVSAAKFDLRLIQGSGTTDIVYSSKVYANVENTDAPNNSITQVIENRFCDGSKFRLQALKVYNGSAYVYSTAWRIGTPAGTGVTLTERLAYTVVAYQKDGYGQRVLQGAIIGDIDVVNCPVIDTAVYWFIAGTFNALNDTLEGEWILLNFDNTGLNLTTGTTNGSVTNEQLKDRRLEDIGGMVNVLNAKVGPLHVSMVDAIMNYAQSGTPIAAPSVGTTYPVYLIYEANPDGDDQMQFSLGAPSSGVVATDGYLLTPFSSETTITVTHNFGTYPIVQLFDSTGAVLIPLSIVHNSVDDFTVIFTTAETGNIVSVVGGSSIYSLTSFTSSVLESVAHNFGSKPNVQLIDNTGAVILPLSIVHNTVNDFDVLFTSSTTGNIISLIGGVDSYLSTSFAAVETVNVTHNFGKYPNSQIIDSTGESIIPLSIIHNSVNDYDVEFTSPQTGVVISTIGEDNNEITPTNLVSKSANYTLTANDYTVNCTTNSFTVTLPTAVGILGKLYNIKNSGTGTITINTTGGQTIDGQASGFWTLAQYDNMAVQSDGANWIIL